MRAPLPSKQTALFALALASLAGCSQGPSTQEPAATPPSPFVLQFVAKYAGSSGSVVLNRDGTYDANLRGSAEHGVFASVTGAKKLPLSLTFTSDARSFAGSIDSYATPSLRLAFGDHTTESLDPQAKVGPDESLCDGSHGTWHDDDSEGGSGSFCVCAAPKVYIPALGGCVD